MKLKLIIPLLSLFLMIAGCTQETQTTINVRVEVDARQRDYQYFEPITVEQFLEEAGIEVKALDRLNPQPWTQIYDGITITIVRVVEEEFCEEIEIPYRQERVQAEGVGPDEERVGQSGQNGLEEVCYRLTYENGELKTQVEISRITTIEPKNEIIYIAPTNELEPVAITGTLVYMNNRNAWIIRGNSIHKRALTVEGNLDRRIFSLSANGRQLLIARQNNDEDAFGNQLWLIPDTTLDEPELIALVPQDVLFAAWVPEENNMISYSTAEPRDSQPGWSAANDFWQMRINPQTGEHINFTKILDQSTSGGPYGWWGMQFKWSPDGNYLAWIRADSIGLVDIESGELGQPLLEYAFLNPLQDWSWRTTVSWSMDNSLITATVHGAPYGNEAPDRSTVFDVAVAAVDGSFSATIIEKTGIWAAPSYSPQLTNTDQPFPTGYLAYLQAREWDESINGEYDLVVADRDGSNARTIFPPPGQPGLNGQVGELAWSPDGRQIAFIYLRNLWIVDVETGSAHQLTQDGGASNPIWAP